MRLTSNAGGGDVASLAVEGAEARERATTNGEASTSRNAGKNAEKREVKKLNSEKTAREKAGGAALAKGAQTKRATAMKKQSMASNKASDSRRRAAKSSPSKRTKVSNNTSVPSAIESKMELDAFLGVHTQTIMVELATPSSEGILDPDLSVLNPFAPPKMSSFSFQSLAHPGDLLGGATARTVEHELFDDASLYARGLDPFTNTSVPGELQGLGYASVGATDALKQQEHGALLKSVPTQNAMTVGRKASARQEEELARGVLPSAARSYRTQHYSQVSKGTSGSHSGSMSGSTGTLLRVPGGASNSQMPSTTSDLIATEDRAVLAQLETIVRNLPDATRTNFRESLLRLMRSSEVAENELASSGSVDKDSNYIDRAVANVLYHRYNDAIIPPIASQNKSQTSNDASTSSRQDEERCGAFPAA
jgi:hypothetical protein